MVLAIQLLLSITSGIAGSIFRKNNQTNMWYIAWPDYNVELDGFITFLVYFLLLNTMIPISLVVSMEIVKLFQKYFLEKDQLMYSKNRDKMVEVRSSALNEELGQIEYVFTDKTGTLTMNFMEFKIATIGNRMFGDINLLTQRGSV